MRKMLSNLALMGLGVIVAGACAELVAGFLYERPWYEQLVTSQVTADPGMAIRRNSYGLRDREYATVKPPQTRRILLLGDSFTFGAGVADDSAIFADIVEQKLNAEYRAKGIDIEVLNAGLPGSLTTDWLNALNAVKDLFQPDVIVVVFFLRDGTLTSSIGGFFGPIRDEIVKRNQASFLYQASNLYRLLTDTIDRKRISSSYTQAIHQAYSGDASQTREWSVAQANLLSIQSIGREMGARVGLVIFPILVDLGDDYPFQDVCDRLQQFGDEHDFQTLHLLTAFKGHDGPGLWVSAYNQHPNAAGHSIAADALMPYLRGLLEP